MVDIFGVDSTKFASVITFRCFSTSPGLPTLRLQIVSINDTVIRSINIVLNDFSADTHSFSHVVEDSCDFFSDEERWSLRRSFLNLMHAF